MSFEICTMLTVSTGHVRPSTAAYLDDAPFAVFRKGDYGWLVYVTDERPDLMPDELWPIIELAREKGCVWLTLDNDGPRVAELPWFEPLAIGNVVAGKVIAMGGTGETDEQVTLPPGWRGVVDRVDVYSGATSYTVAILCPGRPDPDDTIVNVFEDYEVYDCLEVVNEPSPFESNMIDPITA